MDEFGKVTIIVDGTQPGADDRTFDEARCNRELVDPIHELLRKGLIYEVVVLIWWSTTAHDAERPLETRPPGRTPTIRHLTDDRVSRAYLADESLSYFTVNRATLPKTAADMVVWWAKQRKADSILFFHRRVPTRNEVIRELDSLRLEEVRTIELVKVPHPA